MELIVKMNADFREAYTIASESNKLHIIPLTDNEELWLEGDFFYYQTQNGQSTGFNPKTLDDQLRIAFLENRLQPFIEMVEGIYDGIHVDKTSEKITVFSDKLKRQEIYYMVNNHEIIISTSLKKLYGKSQGYHPESVISTLYLYPPKGATVYRNIHRLRYNEIIEISGGNLEIAKHDESPLEILEYDENNLDQLKELIENAIISRASDELNIVELSGGWDSTFLIAVLRKYYDSHKVKAIIMELMLPNGQNINSIEVNKAKRIAEFYGVDLDVLGSNPSDKYWVDLWEEQVKDKMTYQGIYDHYSFSQFLTVAHLQEKYGEELAIFNGEGVDTLHNFGFSQYHSLVHDHRGFCEYGDKMATYLYSPSFFQKVLDDSYADDLVFQIFRWYTRDSQFAETKSLSREDRIFEYLMPFVYGPSRTPFVQLGKTPYVTETGVKRLRNWVKSEYFNEAIEKISSNNLYYWFLRLYTDFHWQGPNIRKVLESHPNARIPFLDYNLFRFFARMPESWGRGLEMNSTKYPLKKLIRDGHYQFPLDVVDAPGIHSYTNFTFAEIQRQNIYDSSLTQHLFQNTDLEAKSREVFTGDDFDINGIRKCITEVKDKSRQEISAADFKLLNFLLQVA